MYEMHFSASLVARETLEVGILLRTTARRKRSYRLYDYEKVLGDAQVSAADRAAFANGEDNTWSRTLRLLYVCCTRAKRGLALVFFVADPDATSAHIVASGIFPEGSVVTQAVLTKG